MQILQSNQSDAKTTQSASNKYIIAYAIYSAVSNISVTGAIWIIYLALHGYSPFIIGLLETLFHVIKFLAEIPTGAFADIIGRRMSLIISNALNAISTILLLIPIPISVIASFVISGIAYAFRGGAGDAMLWNFVGNTNEASVAGRYATLYTRIFLLVSIGDIIGTALGGRLAQIFIPLPFIVQTLALLLGTVALFPIPEQRAATHSRSQPLAHIVEGMRVVWQRRILFIILVYTALMDGIWQTVYFYIQLFFHGKGISLANIGIITAISLLSNFIFIGIAPRILTSIPRKTFLAISGSCMIMGLLAMGVDNKAVQWMGYLVLFQAANGLLIPFMSVFINEHAPESHRATVLSWQTGLFSLMMIVLFPAFGWVVLFVPYQTLYLWMGVGLLLVSLATLPIAIRAVKQ